MVSKSAVHYEVRLRADLYPEGWAIPKSQICKLRFDDLESARSKYKELHRVSRYGPDAQEYWLERHVGLDGSIEQILGIWQITTIEDRVEEEC
jgi:hypothetical protein